MEEVVGSCYLIVSVSLDALHGVLRIEFVVGEKLLVNQFVYWHLLRAREEPLHSLVSYLFEPYMISNILNGISCIWICV